MKVSSTIITDEQSLLAVLRETTEKYLIIPDAVFELLLKQQPDLDSGCPSACNVGPPHMWVNGVCLVPKADEGQFMRNHLEDECLKTP